MTEIMRSFITPAEGDTPKYFVQASWQDVPHISESAEQALLASIPPYQRETRSKGVPQLGAGAVYQIAEEDVVVKDSGLPDHWPRAYGKANSLDAGFRFCEWHRSGEGFLALG